MAIIITKEREWTFKQEKITPAQIHVGDSSLETKDQYVYTSINEFILNAQGRIILSIVKQNTFTICPFKDKVHVGSTF